MNADPCGYGSTAPGLNKEKRQRKGKAKKEYYEGKANIRGQNLKRSKIQGQMDDVVQAGEQKMVTGLIQ